MLCCFLSGPGIYFVDSVAMLARLFFDSVMGFLLACYYIG
jgi:hypothetical protein